ncbi:MULTISPECIES: FMN-binding negative transcriptional regulator [Halomonadaceae]|uniref:FMN-binding negative transcriptional regulator n=1 Tax=Halomonadaceae TaxID=28256 RepID=UPI001598F83E|nr:MULTISPECIES: FMN-binding negative transcriptional regulator [Halomonas]QJQ95624.1 FMN-binding negative transcriptional regulator [Halomonas sp. PA5]
MYLPAQFALADPDALHAAIAAFPFSTLVTIGHEGITANHLPLLLEPNDGGTGVLCGHVARASELWRMGEQDALAIFHGPQAYITPSWYPDKQKHGRVVPTWNYQVVHAHGRLRFIEDSDWLRGVVGKLTDHFESRRPTPWRLEDAPEAYIDGMCRAVVGVELTITRLTGKHKASQHKSLEERNAIREGLQEEYGVTGADAACLSGMKGPA